MRTQTMKKQMTLGAAAVLRIAGAFAIAMASPSRAAPILLNAAATRMAAPNQVTDAHYYNHWHHRHGYYRRGYYRYPGYYDGRAGAAGAAAAAPYYYSYYYSYYYPYYYGRYYWPYYYRQYLYGLPASYGPYGYPYPW